MTRRSAGLSYRFSLRSPRGRSRAFETSKRKKSKTARPTTHSSFHYTLTMSTLKQKDRIVFASCNSQHYAPVLWPSILSRNASAFIWAGDAIYADSFLPKSKFLPWQKRKPLPATPSVITNLYERQLKDRGYRKLLTETDTVILGALDDHGKSRRAKKES